MPTKQRHIAPKALEPGVQLSPLRTDNINCHEGRWCRAFGACPVHNGKGKDGGVSWGTMSHLADVATKTTTRDSNHIG
jgi:hypothetical protein